VLNGVGVAELLGSFRFVVAVGLDVVVLPLLATVLVVVVVVEVGMVPNGVAVAGGPDDDAASTPPSAILVSRFWSTVCSLSLARRSSPRKREPSSTRA
jgi:hypothetical protein